MENNALTIEELQNCEKILLKVLATEDLNPFLEQIAKIFVLAEFISFRISLSDQRKQSESPTNLSSYKEITLETEDDITKLRRVFAGIDFQSDIRDS